MQGDALPATSSEASPQTDRAGVGAFNGSENPRRMLGWHHRRAFTVPCRRSPTVPSPSIATILRDHVALSTTCMDRLYIGGYVPLLQTPGQVATFCRQHLGAPIPSQALFRPLHDRFVHAVESFAAQHHVPILPFVRGQRKDDVAARQRALFHAKHPGVVCIGVAGEGQQFQGPPRRDPARRQLHVLAPAGVGRRCSSTCTTSSGGRRASRCVCPCPLLVAACMLGMPRTWLALLTCALALVLAAPAGAAGPELRGVQLHSLWWESWTRTWTASSTWPSGPERMWCGWM